MRIHPDVGKARAVLTPILLISIRGCVTSAASHKCTVFYEAFDHHVVYVHLNPNNFDTNHQISRNNVQNVLSRLRVRVTSKTPLRDLMRLVKLIHEHD